MLTQIAQRQTFITMTHRYYRASSTWDQSVWITCMVDFLLINSNKSALLHWWREIQVFATEMAFQWEFYDSAFQCTWIQVNWCDQSPELETLLAQCSLPSSVEPAASGAKPPTGSRSPETPSTVQPNINRSLKDSKHYLLQGYKMHIKVVLQLHLLICPNVNTCKCGFPNTLVAIHPKIKCIMSHIIFQSFQIAVM